MCTDTDADLAEALLGFGCSPPMHTQCAAYHRNGESMIVIAPHACSLYIQRMSRMPPPCDCLKNCHMHVVQLAMIQDVSYAPWCNMECGCGSRMVVAEGACNALLEPQQLDRWPAALTG